MNTHDIDIELPPLPEPLEIDWPELHSEALGCGVEDRSIHDRYEAAEYGWQDGVDKAADRVPDQIYDAEQMQAYATTSIEADRKAADDTVLTCDSCGVICQNPWHTSHGENRHVHLCDACYEADRQARGEPVTPEGFRLIAVNETFDSLTFWLDRCEQKGHLENCADLVEPWEAFKYREVEAPQPAEQVIRNSRNTAEPVKVPSDDDIAQLAKKHVHPGFDQLNAIRPVKTPYENTEGFKRIKAYTAELLSSYGQPAQPEPQDGVIPSFINYGVEAYADARVARAIEAIAAAIGSDDNYLYDIVRGC